MTAPGVCLTGTEVGSEATPSDPTRTTRASALVLVDAGTIEPGGSVIEHHDGRLGVSLCSYPVAVSLVGTIEELYRLMAQIARAVNDHIDRDECPPHGIRRPVVPL